jgi:hypothetical protein
MQLSSRCALSRTVAGVSPKQLGAESHECCVTTAALTHFVIAPSLLTCMRQGSPRDRQTLRLCADVARGVVVAIRSILNHDFNHFPAGRVCVTDSRTVIPTAFRSQTKYQRLFSPPRYSRLRPFGVGT